MSTAASRRCRRLSAASALALVACGDDPSAPRPTTPVRLCTDAEFVAHRNEGSGWRRVSVTNGVAEFDATTRVGIAQAWANRPIPYLVVSYLSAEQATQLPGCRPQESAPPVVASAVVRPWNGVGQVELAYGGRRWLHFGADSTFGLPAVSEASDLVAVRASWASRSYVERIFLRRAQTHAAGARIVLDFAGADAFAPDSTSVRFDGPLSGVLVEFRTATGDKVTTYGVTIGAQGDPVMPRVAPIYGVPAARTAPGDLHFVHVEDFSSSTRRRWVDLWTRSLPRDLVLPLGPVAATPVFITRRTSPTAHWVRVDAELPVQEDYGATVRLLYDQSSTRPGGAMVLVTATREYFGAMPAAWRIPYPDVADVAGFPIEAGLTLGGFRWSLWVTGRPGSPEALVGPAEGQLFRTAMGDGIEAQALPPAAPPMSDRGTAPPTAAPCRAPCPP